MTLIAQQVEGIRTVSGSTERDAVFPSPVTGQKVYNDLTDRIEKWSGSEWEQILSPFQTFNVADYGAVGDGLTDDRAAIAEADVAALAAATPGVVVFPSGLYLVNTSLTITSPVVFIGGRITKPDASTVTFNGGFDAPKHRVFLGGGPAIFGPGAVAEAHPAWWGMASSGSAATNGAAIQSAINSHAPVVRLPAGTFSYDSELSIDHGVTIQGAGGPDDANGVFMASGYRTTELTFTKTSGYAITLAGTPAQGIKNVHLRDFFLIGTANADGGIRIGTEASSAKQVNHSSIKNLAIKTFTKVGAYGISFRRMLTSVIENVIVRDCYDGYLFPTDAICTTLTFINVHAYTCSRNGLRLSQGGSFTGSTFIKFVGESNVAQAVYLDGAQYASFYDLYCEDNNTGSGNAPVTLIGSGAIGCREITFYTPYIQNPVGGVCSFELDDAAICKILNPICETYAAGWMTCTASTQGCVVDTASPLLPSTVTNNMAGEGRVMLSSPSTKWRWGESLADDAATSIGTIEGFLQVVDQTNHKCGLFAIRNNTVAVIYDDGAFFAAADTDTKFCVFWSVDTYKIRNRTGGVAQYVAEGGNLMGIT